LTVSSERNWRSAFSQPFRPELLVSSLLIGLPTPPKRTVQRRLAELRGVGKQKAEPSDRPRKLSLTEQKRLLKAAQCGNELIEALERGRPHTQLMQEYKRIGMDTEEIDQILNATPNGAATSSRLPVHLPAQVAGNTDGLVHTSTPVTVLQPRVALPKPGNGIGLANYIVAACGDAFQAALAGLDPSVMATCLQESTRKIVGTFCGFDRERGQITVSIQYVPENALTNPQAA